MGQEIFPVMQGGVGMGQEKSMRGGDEDPILRPRYAPLPSLVVCGLPTIDKIFSFIKSEQIIKDLRAKEVNQPEYGHVLQDFLVLASFFRVCSFSHVKRVSNSIAHFFARQSKLGNELQVWLDSLPDDLAPLALRDFL